MRISLHKTVCMTLVINGSWCLAQPLVSRDDDHLQFQHVTAADGLSDNGVTCIFEDAEGYIWIGTERGLNRYDGQQVQQFSGPGRAPCGSHITSIAQDSAGVIYQDSTVIQEGSLVIRVIHYKVPVHLVYASIILQR